MARDQVLDRRSMLAISLAIIGSAAPFATGSVGASPTTFAKDKRFREWIIANAMGGLDPAVINWTDGRALPSPEILQDALASGMTAAVQTMGFIFGNGDPFELTIRDIGLWERLFLDQPGLLKARLAADIERAKAEDRVALIPAFQSMEMLGDLPDRVDLFVDLGIRIFQLTYNGDNRLGSGCLSSNDRGLTDFGRSVIERLNARRVVIDLSHASNQMCLDSARASKQPIALSHVGCRALMDHPRNATDEALRLVAARGGFVGIYFMPYLTQGRNARPEDLIGHLEYAINLCGEDHVGIGTDGGTTQIDLLSAQQQVAISYAARQAAGIAAPGERPDIVGFIPEMSGPKQFQQLADRLSLRGHSVTRIEKILGLNFMRYVRTIWGS